MKKYLCFLCVLCLLPAAASAESIFNDTEAFTIAKARKIGRESNTSSSATAKIASIAPGQSEAAKLCDANCSSCNNTTGTCSMCKGNRFLYNNLCMICPSYATCKGTASFTCSTGYYKSGTSCSACSSAMAGCTKCTSGTYCTTCSDGYELKNGKCEEKPKCSATLVLSTGAVVDGTTYGGMNGDPAVAKCAALGKRLPTSAELTEMYQKQEQICNMTPNSDAGGWPYWGEKIAGTSYGYRLAFTGGFHGSKGVLQSNVSFTSGSGQGGYVRCVSGGKGGSKNCSSGYAWREVRTGSGGWAAGCYPIGNCNTLRPELSGATCMYVNASTGQGQCKTDSVWTGTVCSIR